MKLNFLISIVACCVGWFAVTSSTSAQDTDPSKRAPFTEKTLLYDASVPQPTLSDVRYGEHERHVLDFWKAPSDVPTPLVFVIHGGAWITRSKDSSENKLPD